MIGNINGILIINECEDIVFLPLGLVFEQTHSSDTGYAATRSTFIFVDTDTEFITTEQFTSN